MIKRAIISAEGGGVLDDVPPGAGVIVDFAERPYDSLLPASLEERRMRLDRVLLSATSLGEARLESFLEGRTATLLRVQGEVSVRAALAGARRLAKPWLEVELPLESESDLDVLKILSSLGVRTRLPVRRLARPDELLSEAMSDALLASARRASLGPITEIERHFFDDGFELAALDQRSNDHHVDLREGAPSQAASWEIPDIAEKRVPFLLERHPCAFCEGLGLCNGYLLESAGPEAACRSVLGELVELIDLARARVPAEGSASSRQDPMRRASPPSRREPRPRGGPPQAAEGARQGTPARGSRRAPGPAPARRALPLIPAAVPVGPDAPGARRRGRPC